MHIYMPYMYFFKFDSLFVYYIQFLPLSSSGRIQREFR